MLGSVLVFVGDVPSFPTAGTVRGAIDPPDVPLGVPDKTEPDVPAGIFGSRICAIAPIEIIKNAHAKAAALKSLLISITFWFGR